MSDPSLLPFTAWRLAARLRGIETFAAELLPALQETLPVQGLLLRRLDPVRTALETIASVGPDDGRDAHRSELQPENWQALLDECRREAQWRGLACELNARRPGLVPAGVQGEVMVLGLRCDDMPVGVAVLRIDGVRLGPEQWTSLASLSEPLAVALDNDRHLRELATLREAAEADRRSLLKRLGRQDIAETIIGSHTGLHEAMERVELVARSDTPVLILGETGTGKEVVARAIHRRSARAGGPFVRVNCGALPHELIDSELFGHERGSFTGAVAARKGWFERADGGTLLLDEIGELTPAAQVRLLRVLQDGSFQRVGGEQPLTVDVRVIAATNRDLHAMVSAGSFREDLWYPASRYFRSACPRCASVRRTSRPSPSHFALRAAERLGLTRRTPTSADLELLPAYGWPGNVRELASVIERAAILGDGRRLEVAQALGGIDLGPRRGPHRSSGNPPPPMHRSTARRRDAPAHRIGLARSQAASKGRSAPRAILGINPHTLRARMRKLGMDWHRFRRPA